MSWSELGVWAGEWLERTPQTRTLNSSGSLTYSPKLEGEGSALAIRPGFFFHRKLWGKMEVEPAMKGPDSYQLDSSWRNPSPRVAFWIPEMGGRLNQISSGEHSSADAVGHVGWSCETHCVKQVFTSINATRLLARGSPCQPKSVALLFLFLL